MPDGPSDKDERDSNLPFYRLPPYQDPTALTNELVSKATTALREVLEARINNNTDKIAQSEAVITRHVDLAIVTLQKSIDDKIANIHENIETLKETIRRRFELGDTATEKAAVNVKTAVDTAFAAANLAIMSTQDIFSEKIRSLTETVGVFKTSVNERFELGDVQTEKAARDVKSAVDAAFAAAKEAVGEQNKSNALSISKSEAATIKTIDQLTENLRLSVKNTDDKIEAMRKTTDDKMADLKDRLVAMEARTQVSDPSTSMALRDMSSSIGMLRQGVDTGAGRSKGMGDSWGIIGFVIMGLIAIAAVLVDLIKR